MPDEPEAPDRVDRFSTEIHRVIDYFKTEFEMTYAETIGVLEIAKHSLLRETFGDDEDDDY